MEARIFTSKIIRDEIPEEKLQLLVSRFKKYKESDDHQDYFGKDATFNRPASVKAADLQHVHLSDGRKWGIRLLQYNRTSDTHIVYCQGYFQPNCYLLITLIKGAHIKYRNNMFMISLAEFAEEFRSKY